MHVCTRPRRCVCVCDISCSFEPLLLNAGSHVGCSSPGRTCRTYCGLMSLYENPFKANYAYISLYIYVYIYIYIYIYICI